VPEIYMSGEKVETTLNSVTYSDDVTPTITEISPRYGSVLGGTTVTLSGSNLSGDATVTFDDRVCEV